jgi:hypothetical protein
MFSYIFCWKFNEVGDAIPTTIAEQREICPQITVPDELSTKTITIAQKEINEEHPTLGCLKTIIGDDTANRTKLKKKSDNIGVRVKNGKLTRKQAWMALNGMFFPSMKYSLPATSLSRQDIDFIQNYTIDKFLSAIGYDHSIHRSIVFGPQEFGGIGIKHLFTEMMSMKLNAIMSHLRANSTLGQAFHINIDYLQLVIGQTGPMFQSRKPINYIDQNWLLHLRNYLVEIDATIESKWPVEDYPSSPKFKALMDLAINCDATPRELRTFNNWRLFFQ